MSASFITKSEVPRVVQIEPFPTSSIIQPVFLPMEDIIFVPNTNQFKYFDNQSTNVNTNNLIINSPSNMSNRLPTIIPVASNSNNLSTLSSLKSVTSISQPTMQIRSQSTMIQPIIRPVTTLSGITQRTVTETQRLPTAILLPSNTMRITQPNILAQPIMTNNTMSMLPLVVPIPNRVVSPNYTTQIRTIPSVVNQITPSRIVEINSPNTRLIQSPLQTILVPTRPLEFSRQSIPISMTTQISQSRPTFNIPTQISQTTCTIPSAVRSSTVTMPISSSRIPTAVRSPTVTMPISSSRIPISSSTVTMPISSSRIPTAVPTSTVTMPINMTSQMSRSIPVMPTSVLVPVMPTGISNVNYPRVTSNSVLPVPIIYSRNEVMSRPSIQSISPVRTNRTMPPLNVTEELEDYDDDLQQAILQSTLESKQISPLPDDQEIEQIVRQTQRQLQPIMTNNLRQMAVDRQIREEQDIEYASSLSIDEAKARQAADIAVLAAANATRAAENAAVGNLRPPQLQYRSQNSSDTITIRVKYPDGNNSNYIFHRDEPLSTLIAQIRYDTKNISGFTLTISPGTFLTCEPDTSLIECGIVNRSVLLINYL